METEPWFKLQLKTPDKRQVHAMARALKKDTDLVLGKLIRWWCWLDLHTIDEHTGMPPESVDDLLRLKNFSRALVDVGWANVAEDGTLDVVRWGEHNGSTAKQRALTSRRVEKHRANKSNPARVTKNAQNAETCNDSSVTNPLQVRYLEKEIDNKERLSLTREPKERAELPAESVTQTPLTGRARPQSADEVLAVMKASPNCGLTGQELANCASSFFDGKEAVGWVDSHGNNIWDWQAAARRYLSAWQDNLARSNARHNTISRSAQRRTGCGDARRYADLGKD